MKSGIFNKYKARLYPYCQKPYDSLSNAEKNEVYDILKACFYETTNVILPKKSFWSKVLDFTGDIWLVFTAIPSILVFSEDYWLGKKKFNRTIEESQKDAVEFRKYFWGIIKSKLLESDEDDMSELSFEDKKALAMKDLDRIRKRRNER